MKRKLILTAYIVGSILFVALMGVGGMVLPQILIDSEIFQPMLFNFISSFFLYWQALVMFVATIVIIIITLIKKENLPEMFSLKKISKKHIWTSLIIGLLFGLASGAQNIVPLIRVFLAFKNFNINAASQTVPIYGILVLLRNTLIIILNNGLLTALFILLMEMLFHGWLFKKLQNLSNVWVAICITTVLIAAIFPYRFGIVLAFILGLIYYKIKSIWSPFIIGVVTAIFNSFHIAAEKIRLMFSPLNYSTADVISTYVYRKGLEETQKNLTENLLFYIQNNIISIISLAVVSVVIIWYLSRMKEDLNKDEYIV